jgi:hypothetical protein
MYFWRIGADSAAKILRNALRSGRQRPASRLVAALTGVAAITLLWTLPVRPAQAQVNGYTFTNVADTTGELGGFFIAPTINDLGTCAFLAYVKNGPVGIFTGDGSAPPVTIADTDGPAFTFGTQSPPINNSGAVAYWAWNDDGGEGIYCGNAYYAADRWTIADNMTQGDIASFEMGYSYLSLNEAGSVAFSATLLSGRSRVMVGDGGTIQQMTVPSSTELFEHPTMSNSGWVAFRESAAWVDLNPCRINIIDPMNPPFYDLYSLLTEWTYWAYSPDSPFVSYGPPAINNANTTALTYTLTSGIAGILTSDFVPNVPAWFSYSHTYVVDSTGPFQSFGAVSINDLDTIVFWASLDVVWTSPNSGGHGIYVGSKAAPGVTAPVIQTGDALFDSTVTSVRFSRDGLNNVGQVAFQYRLANGRRGIAVATPEVVTPEP